MKTSYSIEETAKFLETTIWTMYKRIEDSALKGYRVAGGRNIRIPHEELIKFMKSNNIPIPRELEPDTRKILIVDDNANTIRSLEKHCKLLPGYDIKSANSGFQAGILAKTFKPNIILLDIKLGGTDVREVIKALKNDSELNETMVIGISESLNDTEIEELLKNGFDACLTIPFRPSELMALIEKPNK